MSLDASIFRTYSVMTGIGAWIGLLGLRLVLAWEFWQAGTAKFYGDNWFDRISDEFFFPFNIIPVAVSWFLATWVEIIGALALTIGLTTRFWAAGLIILDIVAWGAVHADSGYNVCDNGYKLPLIYLTMLFPLLLMGPGKFSVDYAFSKHYQS